jgi:hypothetical protein
MHPYTLAPDDSPLTQWYVVTVYGQYYPVQDQDAESAIRQVTETHGIHPDHIVGATKQSPQDAVNALF